MSYLYTMLLTTVLCSSAFISHAEEVPNKYPAIIGKAFIKSCTEGDSAMQDYCGCVFEGVQKAMTFKEFSTLSETSDEDMLNDTRFAGAIEGCISKLTN